MGKRYTLTTKDALWSDEPAKSGMAPINKNARVAPGLLLRDQRLAPNAATELWDFALENSRASPTIASAD